MRRFDRCALSALVGAVMALTAATPVVAGCPGPDADGDGIGDACDNCPAGPRYQPKTNDLLTAFERRHPDRESGPFSRRRVDRQMGFDQARALLHTR